MEFVTKDVQTAISKLKGLINTKSPLLAIRGILYKDGTFCATDLNVHAKISVSTGLVPSDETFIIPNIAFEAIGKITAPTLAIESVDGNKVLIWAGRFNTTFSSVNPSDFPHFD